MISALRAWEGAADAGGAAACLSAYGPLAWAAVGRPFGASGLNTARRRKAKANAFGALPWCRLGEMVRPLGAATAVTTWACAQRQRNIGHREKAAGVSTPR